MSTVFIIYLICGIIIVVLSIPLIKGIIPPNHWYGLRVRETLDNKNIWYEANKISGKYLLIYGISIILFNILIMLLNVDDYVYSIGMSIYVFVGAVTFGVLSNKVVIKLNKKANIK